MAELKRRMAPRGPVLPPPDEVGASVRDGGRARAGTRRSDLYRRQAATADAYPGDAQDSNLLAMQLKAMQQAIYSVQGRLKEMHATLSKYELDMRARLAFIFTKLDNWQYEMHAMYQHVTLPKNISPLEFSINEHIVYYANFLRKNIDVTYTVDYLLSLHQEIKRTVELDEEQFQQASITVVKPRGPQG